MAKKHQPEEIVAKLRQVDVLTSQGTPIADAVRSIGVSEVTYYRWRNAYANEISPSELRAMLTMKRAQLEQSLTEEQARLRHIESRIAQIDRHGGIDDYDTSHAPSIPAAACACGQAAQLSLDHVLEDRAVTRSIRRSLAGQRRCPIEMA